MQNHVSFAVRCGKVSLPNVSIYLEIRNFSISIAIACVESAKILSQWKHCRDIKLMHTLANLVMPMQITKRRKKKCSPETHWNLYKCFKCTAALCIAHCQSGDRGKGKKICEKKIRAGAGIAALVYDRVWEFVQMHNTFIIAQNTNINIYISNIEYWI